MRFIQENGYTFELDQIAGDKRCVDHLTRLIEESCRLRYGMITGDGTLSICWKEKAYLVWYCATGDLVTLVSVMTESL